MQLNANDQKLIELALSEDLGASFVDITTATLFADKKIKQQARIISKHPQPITLCGLSVAHAIITHLGSVCTLESARQDGDTLMPGEVLFTLHGSANDLLMLERTLLNFLQHLCAVATLTKRFVDAVKGSSLKILDTRKTMPGFRHLDKYAVCCGGGVNHRMGLYDALMVKDTHVDLLGGMEPTLARLSVDVAKKFPVIVEVRNLAELATVLTHGRDKVARVLLDNMSVELLAECVGLCRGIFPTEASGNITLDNIARIAQTGVDFASLGALTHSAGNVDLSMQCG